MNNNSNCLNCNEPISQEFCPNCGQKTDTHRITFKHFVTHDILHGVWHFEKGILFTIKETIVRPGKAALDYISGKRIRYYNVFYLILLIIGLNLLLANYYDTLCKIYNITPTEMQRNDAGKRIHSIIIENAKILIYLFVPIFALNSYLVFKRKKLNISEHFIIAGITFLGVMLLTTTRNVLFFLDFTNSFEIVSEIANLITPLLILFYIIFSFYSAFKNEYTPFGFSLRIVLFFIITVLELIMIFLLISGYATNWKFGNIVY